jgi:hypothetical protein
MKDDMKLHAVVVSEEGGYAVKTVRHDPSKLEEGKPFKVTMWKGNNALDNKDIICLLIPRNIGKSLKERSLVFNASLAAGVSTAVID